jgi:ATP10 protein
VTDRDRVPADKVKETMSEPAMDVSGVIRLPHLAARDLEGRSLELPGAFSGASNLVIVAFRREQQSMVDSWIAWWETIAAEHPSLQCYEIPVIATRWSLARPVINGGMAQAVRAQEARSRTFTVYTDVRRVTDALGIDATDTVTVLLVDADGRLRWRTAGPVSEHSGSKLRAALTADSSQDAGAVESLAIEQFEFAFDSQFRPFLALDRCHFRYGARDAHGGQARGPLRAVDVRNPDRQCAQRVPHGPPPLV